ncbi:zinc ribbon domain-containing protein [Acetanaerobacterium elongatum]|uniref:Double zinc ribbon n=1 Tax=Acetanaerobacterium elongatum TaxID=258515 RepID=A0A1H0C2C2_9FIRM|nr:zinc ribbon domain-containing protein [Acetanaerobacterium elongatum]SDN52021.1 Double zinc ribbon [Acetanaerobacterium elongatum]
MEFEFLEKMGETISTKSKDVAKKVKDMSDVSKLNSQIADEEGRKNGLFKKIGQLYFEKYKDNESDQFIVEIREIIKAQQQIEEYKKEVNAIKGVTLCPGCGNEVPVSTTFCGKCGAKIPAAEPAEAPVAQPEGKTCPACGKPAGADDVFCGYCGAKF